MIKQAKRIITSNLSVKDIRVIVGALNRDANQLKKELIIYCDEWNALYRNLYNKDI